MADSNPADNQPKSPSQNADARFLQETPEWWEEKLRNPNLTAEDREALIGKIKGYDKGYKSLKDDHNRRLQELAEYEKEVKQVAENLKQTSSAFKPPTTKAEGKKLLDAWIDEADAQGDSKTARSLEAMRKMIVEETDSGELKKELQELREANKFLQQAYFGEKRQAFSSQLKELTKVYGDLIDKYQEPVLKLWDKFPTLSAERLLWNAAPEDEIRQALIVHARKTGKDDALPARRTGPVASSEERSLYEKYKGKNPRETAENYKQAVAEAVQRAREKIGAAR